MVAPIPVGIIVEWRDNPLVSPIFLDNHGRLLLRYGIALDAVCDAQATIKLETRQPGKWLHTFEYADLEAGVDSIKTEIEHRAVEMERYLADAHCGDCTSVPATCVRCHAESLLGFTTIPNVDKGMGHEIQSAFGEGYTHGRARTIEDAIVWLRTAPITATWDGWQAHLPRWRMDRDKAAAWLEQYRLNLVNGDR